MRLIFPVLLALAAAVAVPPSARAQESDEALKKRIMDGVKKQLAAERKAILERMSKVIDEELGGGAKPDPAPGPKSPDKSLRDLERKLQALDDQRADVLRDIRGIKREAEDASIAKETEDLQRDIQKAVQNRDQQAFTAVQKEVADEFKTYFDTHNEATNLLKKDRDQALKKFDKSIAGFKRLYYALRGQPVMKGTAVPSAYNVACGYALAGNNEQALDWLWISIMIGYDDFDHIRQDSDLDGLRKERRYLRLLSDR
jgi:hypothetical protein